MIIRRIPVIARRILRQIGFWSADRLPTAKDVAPARQYIEEFWPKLIRKNTKDDDSLIGLPHPYLVSSFEPEHDFDFNEMYYWDTYFMAQGFFRPQDEALLNGLLDNQLYLLERFGLVPNATRTYLTGRSQPPFLTTLIFQMYDTYDKDAELWLRPKIEAAKREYHDVWMGTRKPNNRRVHHGLSRYYSPDMTHDQAELESGWDYTPRFQHRCLDFLPVDLNALLYKYETDFARAAAIFGDETEARQWQAAARSRRKTMTELMWSGHHGLFYDYDYVHGHRGPVSSLAAYYCLWSGLATRRQAKAMVRSLEQFEYHGGLTATDDGPLNPHISMPGMASGLPTQWAYPNGWAPLHFIVIRGLERYGYRRIARRIALKWLRTNLDWFNTKGVFLEKYNVVETGEPPSRGVYPSQAGFGWTNAVFEYCCRKYLDTQEEPGSRAPDHGVTHEDGIGGGKPDR